MPRRLLRDGRIVLDEWRTSDEAGLADDSPLMLTFGEWQSDRDRWRARGGRLGVVLAPADLVERLAADLAGLDLVGAEFPGPSEGRGYTQGRLLRERWNFTGELRARGAIRRDHLFFLARCGFNSFELPESELESASAAFRTFSAAYQPSNDRGLPQSPRHRSTPSGIMS
jgi:uncharacterized protein (DUF934 family)